MSVIAWDGKALAVDRLGMNSGMRSVTRKSMNLSGSLGPIVCAWTGTHEQGLVLAAWFAEGEHKDKWPAFQRTDDWTRLVVLKADKRGNELFVFEREPVRQYEDPSRFLAWGAGRDFAMGALSMGATAAEAVKVTEAHCVSVGFGVDEYLVTADGGIKWRFIP